MASGNADPRVTTLLLVVTGIETLVLFGAGVGLVVQPAVIGPIGRGRSRRSTLPSSVQSIPPRW